MNRRYNSRVRAQARLWSDQPVTIGMGQLVAFVVGHAALGFIIALALR